MNRSETALTLVSVWLCLSPFVLGIFGNNNATLAMILLGALALLFTLIGHLTRKAGEEWGTMCAGLILLVSPWMFEFTHLVSATVNATLCALILIALSIGSVGKEKDGWEADLPHKPGV